MFGLFLLQKSAKHIRFSSITITAFTITVTIWLLLNLFVCPDDFQLTACMSLLKLVIDISSTSVDTVDSCDKPSSFSSSSASAAAAAATIATTTAAVEQVCPEGDLGMFG